MSAGRFFVYEYSAIALRRLPPQKGNWKYIPKEYRSELLGKAYMRHIDVQEFMEEVCSPLSPRCATLCTHRHKWQDPEVTRWLKFAQRGISGCYKDQSAFLGMLDAIMKVEERRYKGKKLMNMKYDAHFDLICTNLALISPRAYKVIQAEFAGRTLRSMR